MSLVTFPFGHPQASLIPSQILVHAAARVSGEEGLLRFIGIPEPLQPLASKQFRIGRAVPRIFGAFPVPEEIVSPVLPPPRMEPEEIREFLKRQGPALQSLFESLPKRFYSGAMTGPYLDETAGSLQYRVRLPYINAPTKGFVALVDLIWDGKILECAIKKSKKGIPNDAVAYRRTMRRCPEAGRFLPRLYGTVGNFCVMERLSGWEGKEITDRLETDPEFLKTYAKAVFDLVESVALFGLRFTDQTFQIGWNCLFDFQTASIRVVELGSLMPSPLRSEEIMALQLMKEVQGSGGHDFVFELLRIAFQKRDPSLYTAPASFMSRHLTLADLWAHTRIGSIVWKTPLRRFFSGGEMGFSSALIDVVQNGDRDGFRKRVSTSRRYLVRI